MAAGASRGRAWRGLEAAALFGATPAALAVFLSGRMVLPWLWLVAVACAAWLSRGGRMERAAWGWGRRPAGLGRRILVRAAAGIALLTLLLAAIHPDYLFDLPRTRPGLWLLIALLYPLLSVYPQGIVYRAFFRARYGDLFPPRLEPWVAAAAFSWAHVVFGNGWALGFTLIGGRLFYGTWLRYRSLLATAAEQSLFGVWLFTVGWGRFLYHGTAALARSLVPQ